MKKIFLLVVFSLSLAALSTAQFGVKAGMNFAKMSGAEIDGLDQVSLNNFHAGVFMEKDIIPLINIRFGLNYSPKGFKNELDADNYMQSTLNYLEIPILAKVKLGPVYALGGVYGAYALNGKNEISVLGITDSQDINFDDSEISKLDYGMTFGLGVQVGLGPVHVFAQADYSFGLKNINTSDGDAAKNNVIGVSVGILLGM